VSQPVIWSHYQIDYNKSEYDKQQQMQQAQLLPQSPVTNAPETLRINTGDG